jgi:hypothetical protein
MFTYRDFEGGTLGLAWTGDLKNAGGVCEKNGVSATAECSASAEKRVITFDCSSTYQPRLKAG